MHPTATARRAAFAVQPLLLLLLLHLLLAGAAFLLLACEAPVESELAWIDYPAASRGDVVDRYHGVEVADPYRWLEDEDSAETVAWLAAQDAITERFFAEHTARDAFVAELADGWVEGVPALPVRRGDRTFRWHSPAGHRHDVLSVTVGDGEPQVIFDLDRRHPDRNVATNTDLFPSPRGRYVGYELHWDGADVADIHLYDTEAGEELDEALRGIYGEITAWLPDESGFFYTWNDLQTLRGEAAAKKPGVYFHAIGEPVASDRLVYRRAWNGRYMAFAELMDDGERLLVHDMDLFGGRGRWGVRPIEGGPETPVRWLYAEATGDRFAFVGTHGSEVFLVTDHDAPKWRVVAIDVERPGLDNLRQVVPQAEDPIGILGGYNVGQVVLHGDRLLVVYIRHTSHVIRVFDLEGRPRGEFGPPFHGAATGISTAEGDAEILVGFESFLRPASVYAHDLDAGTLRAVEVVEPPIPPQQVEETRVFYRSFDGTQVPMTILRPKDAPRDGSSQTILYGYGGWGLPTLPRFRNRVPAWLARGHTWAVAHLRGGGEYGVPWHEAGQRTKKQDVFEDFYAAAEYLAAAGYTSPRRLTILGASNGGLLTAVAYNQRPELFGAVISKVAVTDMLRIQDTPVGGTTSEELGHPDESLEMFRYLLAYSPLHNVRREGPFPPILHVVGENDPRCTPGHVYKLVAEMQRGLGLASDAERLAILRLVRGVGHGSRDEEGQRSWFADELAFAEATTSD